MSTTTRIFRPPANPGQAIERHFDAAQRADEAAADMDAKGLPLVAKSFRRSAAGHRAAITRIAKSL